jgi:molecular chaperone DnaJ
MDFYTLLSLARTASEGEIERAYRRLARRYHPGINPGDAMAAEMFRQIEEAYRVLRDVEQRREYDRGTARPAVSPSEATVSFTGFDFSAPAEGPQAATFSELFADVFQEAARELTSPSRGASIDVALTVSFADAVRGGHFPVSVLRQERCPGCGGHGLVSRAPARCPACGGEGSRRWARGHMVFATACERCDGRGQLSADRCRFCAGVGVQARSEVVTVTIPAGLEDGARVAVPGRGHTGARGGPAGDLYVTVTVAPHPYLRRAGRDLVLTLPVAVHEAALGARVDVPSLDGPVRLRIPPGAASGQRLRVSGHGVPAATPGGEPGDLLVEIQIVLPPVRDERSRELLKEFARLNDVDVRAHLNLNGR